MSKLDKFSPDDFVIVFEDSEGNKFSYEEYKQYLLDKKLKQHHKRFIDSQQTMDYNTQRILLDNLPNLYED